jgi:ferredoxin
MANKHEKNPGNVPGDFYVDSTCIDCDLCRTTAPATFRRDDDSGVTIVYRQPSTVEEIAQAREGMEGCPTDSIGCDG